MQKYAEISSNSIRVSFFSRTDETFFRIHHMLSHKTSLNKFNIQEVKDGSGRTLNSPLPTNTLKYVPLYRIISPEG